MILVAIKMAAKLNPVLLALLAVTTVKKRRLERRPSAMTSRLKKRL